jgi:hypothetical protein
MIDSRSAGRPAGWRRLLALRPSMVDFERRGFRTEPAGTRRVLESAGRAFLDGFNLELATPVGRAPDLSHLEAHHRGFAAEGAAMAAALLDALNPRHGSRFAVLSRAHHERHAYLLHVGAGWAMAKLRRRRLGRLGADEPLLRWLAYDGMGFCQAFFANERRMHRWNTHPGRCDATCDIRYQGLGRSLWFRECGEPERLAARVKALPTRHRADTWSGVALAASYAAGTDEAVYERLRDASGSHRAAVAQGAAFAAEAWRRSGFTPPSADLAVGVLAGAPTDTAAAWTWRARQGLDTPHADATAYRIWRIRVQHEAAAVRR